MLKLAQEGGLFAGRVPEALQGPPWAFHAGDVAAIHSDESHDLHITALKIQEKFGLQANTLPYGARRNVKYICKMVLLLTLRHSDAPCFCQPFVYA